MTQYQVEVRAVDARYDTYAHQLVREIAQLSTNHLPSLATLATHISQPDQPTIQTSQIYRLSGHLDPSHINVLSQQLLINPVTQTSTVTSVTFDNVLPDTSSAHVIDVFFHPGVTDTLAESVITGARMLDIVGIDHAETGRRYRLDDRLSVADARSIAQALLYNPIIQRYNLYPAQNQASQPDSAVDIQSIAIREENKQGSSDLQSQHKPSSSVKNIPLSTMSDEQLLALSKDGLLSLNIQEMRAIAHYYYEQQREPTDVELETLAQTWSEHCSHKTFKATVNYRELDGTGKEISSETIHGLLKHYIMRATDEIKPDWLVSAFSDNAGIVRLTQTQDIAFKVETHNHPSAIEPFGGANTGVGGVIRDVVGVSAYPIANTDVLCFGPLDTPEDDLPAGVLSPRRIATGVVNGVRDYGNKMGIPTVNGAILYHPGYRFNPLVFCGCLGILPHGSHPREVTPGDLIVSLGGRTGRDGIHGATFSSGEMSVEINAQAGTAVQIGAPITEKKVTDVIIQARDRHLYHAITDCGAGGFSSAIGEMGEDTGARVELSNAPLKYQGLQPWEIWLSEAQERMILAVPPSHIDELLALCELEEVEASVLGTFTDDRRLVLTYHEGVVADLAMDFLHHGQPIRTLDATWTHNISTSSSSHAEHTLPSLGSSLEPTLLALLRHPSIASKEEVVRRYDHEVQGATVIKPLVGRAGNGPGDAAVLRPLVTAETSLAGVVLSNGINPLYGQVDPYLMAMNAVDEALRNLTAVGGDVNRTAILDNFCWGNPTDPEQLGMLVRAVKGCYDAAIGFSTPFVSGKDSLNNEYRMNDRRLPVIPTLLISAMSVIDDVTPTIDMALKTPGNVIYQVGATYDELKASHYAEVIDKDSFATLFPQTSLPRVNTITALRLMQTLGEAIRSGLVRSCHDLSEGGLAVAAAEMSLASMLGMTLYLDQMALRSNANLTSDAIVIAKLFSESASRFLVEITPEQVGTFERFMRAHGVNDFANIGIVTKTSRFMIRQLAQTLIDVDVAELQAAWKGEPAS